MRKETRMNWFKTNRALREENEELKRDVKQLVRTLKPFADFADPQFKIPPQTTVTQGSPMAKRQILMEDCYRATVVVEMFDADVAEE
jgi:hypothetical protein